MRNTKEIETIRNGMLLQDKRGTAYPIFIVVEEQKIYWVSDNIEGRERYGEEFNREGACEECTKLHDDGKDIPDDCEDCDDECFVSYRIEKDVPNLRAGFFFTANACNEHLERNRHHYNKTAHSYAISAYHNEELKAVMVELIGEANAEKLR